MTENLFNQPDNQLPQIDENKNYLEELVGDNKKFKTPQDLAKGKALADAYVDHLKQELDIMRADYLALRQEHQTGASLKEIIDQMKQEQQSNVNQNLPDNDVKQPELKLEDIKKSILEELQKERSAEQERNNFNLVQAKLKERFGNNSLSILKQQRETLGMTEDQVNALARQSPQAFFKLMGLDEQKQTQGFQSPPSSVVRQEFAPSTGAQRTWSWWQQMKKDKPREYWDPKNINQRHKDAVELGEAFNDGDAERWERMGNPTLRYG